MWWECCWSFLKNLSPRALSYLQDKHPKLRQRVITSLDTIPSNSFGSVLQCFSLLIAAIPGTFWTGMNFLNAEIRCNSMINVFTGIFNRSDVQSYLETGKLDHNFDLSCLFTWIPSFMRSIQKEPIFHRVQDLVIDLIQSSNCWETKNKLELWKILLEMSLSTEGHYLMSGLKTDLMDTILTTSLFFLINLNSEDENQQNLIQQTENLLCLGIQKLSKIITEDWTVIQEQIADQKSAKSHTFIYSSFLTSLSNSFRDSTLILSRSSLKVISECVVSQMAELVTLTPLKSGGHHREDLVTIFNAILDFFSSNSNQIISMKISSLSSNHTKDLQHFIVTNPGSKLLRFLIACNPLLREITVQLFSQYISKEDLLSILKHFLNQWGNSKFVHEMHQILTILKKQPNVNSACHLANICNTLVSMSGEINENYLRIEDANRDEFWLILWEIIGMILEESFGWERYLKGTASYSIILDAFSISFKSLQSMIILFSPKLPSMCTTDDYISIRHCLLSAVQWMTVVDSKLREIAYDTVIQFMDALKSVTNSTKYLDQEIIEILEAIATESASECAHSQLDLPKRQRLLMYIPQHNLPTNEEISFNESNRQTKIQLKKDQNGRTPLDENSASDSDSASSEFDICWSFLYSKDDDMVVISDSENSFDVRRHTAVSDKDKFDAKNNNAEMNSTKERIKPFWDDPTGSIKQFPIGKGTNVGTHRSERFTKLLTKTKTNQLPATFHIKESQKAISPNENLLPYVNKNRTLSPPSQWNNHSVKIIPKEENMDVERATRFKDSKQVKIKTIDLPEVRSHRVFQNTNKSLDLQSIPEIRDLINKILLWRWSDISPQQDAPSDSK